jgi:type II secretory pathway pseudopilin PulG
LEVILAIAILGGCMAVIGELVRMGVRNAEEARELTKAQLLCEGKLEEVAAGATPLEAASAVAFELDPEWTYTIEVGSLDQQGLVQVRVTVQAVESERLYPLTFTLSRWMVDPSLASGETSTGSTTEGQAATSGSSNGTSR